MAAGYDVIMFCIQEMTSSGLTYRDLQLSYIRKLHCYCKHSVLSVGGIGVKFDHKWACYCNDF